MNIVRFIGKFLISVGCGVLMFVAWTLWGTGLITSRHQHALEAAWAHEPAIELEDAEGIKVPENYQPELGEGVFRLKIPRIDFNDIVVEGVNKEDLYKGPGHYPECRANTYPPLCTKFEEAWPGEEGRVIVSGHRTTYGAPFYDLDKLKEGDEIETETRWGDFTYEVTSLEIVDDTSLQIVVEKLQGAELVLTTCNPKFSAEQRLIVYAKLVP